MDNTELDRLLTEWHAAVQNANHWTAKEMELRKQIFNGMFINPVVGTNKVKIAHGMALIGDYRMNYKIDKAVMEESRGFIPVHLLEAVISYRPEVKAGGWKKLSDEEKKHFGAFITETPGSPGLELKPANKVRW
ncbi:hypothetical protein [Aminobacter phage Erebus]|nr:hypothetical protein [Aminobacter phage Erebus]